MTAAKRATFDAGAQRRRAMIGKIHVARKQLAMVEDDYRQLLFAATGRMSAADCSEGQLGRVIERLEQLGFQPLPKAGKKGAAQHPMARKARAMWISLHQLGVVHNASEGALEAFAKRQLGCERLVWARQSDAYRLIEALKGMAVRAGWVQHNRVTGKPLDALGLQQSLCVAILERLQRAGIAAERWTLNDAAYRLCGIKLGTTGPVTTEEYTALAGGLGKKLRDAAVQGAPS